jgi:Amt family ammonium transporter
MLINCRSKNTVNILIKNIVDVLIGGVAYWATGWGLSFGRGTSGILGTGEFFSYGIDPNIYPLWFFQFVFAATTSTIVSGALAERVEFSAYFLYSLILTGNFLSVHRFI